VVKEVAGCDRSGFVDWFARQLRRPGSRPPERSGLQPDHQRLLPNDRSHALAAAGLLEAWGARPIELAIDLNWATGRSS